MLQNCYRIGNSDTEIVEQDDAIMCLDDEAKFKEAVDKLNRNINARSRQGLVLLSPMVLILIFPFVPGTIAGPLSIIMIICGTVGLAWAVYWGRGGRRLLYGISLIQQLGPPYPAVGTRYAFVVVNSIYIFATWDSGALLFVRILDQRPANKQKMQLLKPIWAWKYNKEVDGISIARKEGNVCIPDMGDNYVSGNGIVYAIPLERGYFVQHKYHIDNSTLMRISRLLLLDLLE